MSGMKSLYGFLKKEALHMKHNSLGEMVKNPEFYIFGNQELYAQGHISVDKYSETEIFLTVDKMKVYITGRGLSMCFYNRKTVKLDGFITGITYERQQ